MCILFCGTNKKNVLQKELKNLTFEVSNLSTVFKILSYNGPNIYDIRTERGLEGLEISHVVIDAIVFKQQVYGPFLRMKCGRVCGLVVYGRHNCMISNIKTYFDKKIILPALVLVLQ